MSIDPKTMPPAPLAPDERLHALDVLRGLALLGILAMNMPGFAQSFSAGADGERLWPQWWNIGADFLRDTLMSGKFNALFSLLFAIGFTLQVQRLQGDKSPLIRRSGWLFVFGLLHVVLLWGGDILHLYALFGLLLLVMHRWSDRALVVAFVAVVLASPLRSIWRWMHWTPQEGQARLEKLQSMEALDNAAIGHGTWLEAAQRRAADFIDVYTHPLMWPGALFGTVMLLSTVILGLWLARRGWLSHPEQHGPKLRRMALACLALGVVLGAYAAVFVPTIKPTDPPGLLRMSINLAYTLSRLLVMLAIAFGVCWLTLRPKWNAWLTLFAAPGRMPLTQYLLQSVIGTLIFSGWGLGWWGRVGPAMQMLMAFVIFFLIQVPLSRWWLARFRFGPMEHLWRRLTYGPGVGSWRTPAGSPRPMIMA